MPRPHPNAIATWASLPRRPPPTRKMPHGAEQSPGGDTRYLILRWGPGLSRGPCSGTWEGQAGAPAAPSPGRRHDKAVTPTRALGSPQSSLPWTERTKSVWPRHVHTHTHVQTYTHTVQEEGRPHHPEVSGQDLPTGSRKAPCSPGTFTQALRSGQAQE